MMKPISVWKQELAGGTHTARLASLYCCSPEQTAAHAARYAAVLDGLEATFGAHTEAGLYSAPGHGIVHQRFQDALEIGVADIPLRLGKVVQLHGHQQLVADVDLVIGQDEPGVQPIVDELLNGSRDHSTAPPSGRMERMWHLPAPRMASISALKASSFSSGTKACTVPAKPPP